MDLCRRRALASHRGCQPRRQTVRPAPMAPSSASTPHRCPSGSEHLHLSGPQRPAARCQRDSTGRSCPGAAACPDTRATRSVQLEARGDGPEGRKQRQQPALVRAKPEWLPGGLKGWCVRRGRKALPRGRRGEAHLRPRHEQWSHGQPVQSNGNRSQSGKGDDCRVVVGSRPSSLVERVGISSHELVGISSHERVGEAL